MGDLLNKLGFDCRWRRDPAEREPKGSNAKCGAMFIDLTAPPPLFSLPPGAMGLRVVQGGKS